MLNWKKKFLKNFYGLKSTIAQGHSITSRDQKLFRNPYS